MKIIRGKTKMGLKFWKKKEDDLGGLGDMSDLGDFGLDDTPGAGGNDLGLGSDALPPEHKISGMDNHMMHDTHSGMEPPTHPGETGTIDQPASLESHGMEQTGTVHATQSTPYQSVPQQPINPSMQGMPGLHDLTKDIEIMHAKLDAIRSSLDSINQRLATLERIASGDNKNRYGW